MDDVVQQLGDLGLFVVRLGSNLYADGRWVNGVGFRAAPATGVPAAGTAAAGGGEEGRKVAAPPAGPGPTVLDLDRVALCSIFRGLDCRQKCACALVCKEWRAALKTQAPWDTLDFTGCPTLTDLDLALLLLRRAADDGRRPDGAAAAARVWEGFPVRRLDLAPCDLISEEALGAVLRGCNRLESLRLPATMPLSPRLLIELHGMALRLRPEALDTVRVVACRLSTTEPFAVQLALELLSGTTVSSSTLAQARDLAYVSDPTLGAYDRGGVELQAPSAAGIGRVGIFLRDLEVVYNPFLVSAATLARALEGNTALRRLKVLPDVGPGVDLAWQGPDAQAMLGDAGAAALADALPRCEVTHLVLDANGVGDVGGLALAEAMLRGAKLEVLSLNHNRLQHSAARGLVEAGRSCGLQELSLSFNLIANVPMTTPCGPPSRLAALDLSFNPWDWRCSAANGTFTQFFLGPGARLRQLDLSHTGMDCHGALHLVAALQASGNRALATINLDHNAIGNAGCHELGSLLGAADYRLSSFTIGWNNIGDAGLGFLLRNGVRDLSVLGLHGNGLCAPAAVTLSGVLRAARNLRALNLSHNEFDGPCFCALMDALTRPGSAAHAGLESLYCANNSAGDLGASAVATMLESDPKLLFLDLDANGIGDDGLARLVDSLLLNTSVLHVSCMNNPMTYEGMRRLEACLKAKSNRTTEVRLAAVTSH